MIIAVVVGGGGAAVGVVGCVVVLGCTSVGLVLANDVANSQFL